MTQSTTRSQVPRLKSLLCCVTMIMLIGFSLTRLQSEDNRTYLWYRSRLLAVPNVILHLLSNKLPCPFSIFKLNMNEVIHLEVIYIISTLLSIWGKAAYLITYLIPPFLYTTMERITPHIGIQESVWLNGIQPTSLAELDSIWKKQTSIAPGGCISFLSLPSFFLWFYQTGFLCVALDPILELAL